MSLAYSHSVQLTPNFNIAEFKCHDGTNVPEQYFGNVIKLAQNLQLLRNAVGKPITINSGYRTVAYNNHIYEQQGQQPTTHSQHLTASAADIVIAGMTPLQVYNKIEQLIASGDMQQGGHGIYDTFNHYDVRGTKARWDMRKKKQRSKPSLKALKK